MGKAIVHMRTALAALMLCSLAARADDVSVAQLHWMTGSWSGPLGESTIEEVWSTPRHGSMAASVRFYRDGRTTMHEYITIAEENGTLVLRLMQWSPAMKALKERFEVLHLSDLGADFVTFTAQDNEGGGLKALTYRREGESTFSVTVTVTEGNTFKATLEGGS